MEPPKEPLSERVATYEDVLAAPADRIAELINGRLILSPRPAMPHSTAASVLEIDLGGPFMRGRGGPGGWWLNFEPELHLGKEVLVPDLAGWRRERLPTAPRGAAMTLAPDWVCEVLSPSTAATDRVWKLPIYAREKVNHIWLVDPEARTVEVLALENGRWVLTGAHGGDEKVRLPPFEAVELELSALWGG